MESHWKVKYASKRGLRHEFQKLLCQDRVCYKERGELQIIALADGTSASDLCVIGVEKVLEAVCERILELYDRIEKYLEEGDEAAVQNILAQKIKFELEKIAVRYHVPARTFSSTLQIVCLNAEKNKFFAIHLGDGIIIAKRDGNYQILSQPENGSQTNQTYLTTSGNAREHIRIIYQKMEDDINEVILLSDGIYEKTYEDVQQGKGKEEMREENLILEAATESLKSILERIVFENKIDDQGMIMIYRR